MTRVRVSFVYEPDEPDEDDDTGVSNEEFEKISDALMMFGAEDVKFEKIA